jgi:hypothetical protein
VDLRQGGAAEVQQASEGVLAKIIPVGREDDVVQGKRGSRHQPNTGKRELVENTSQTRQNAGK